MRKFVGCVFGDPDGNRTRVTALKGPCLNLLTTGPTKTIVSHLKKMVGAEGFEPPTPWSQTRCATKLRYAPLDVTKCILANKGIFVKYF